MDQIVKSFADEAGKLSPEQQAELIDVLIGRLSQEPDEWDRAWSAEAERRWALVKAGKMASFPAAEVLSDIAAHLEKRRRRA